MNDLPADLQAQLQAKAAAQQRSVPGLRLSDDGKSYVYSAPVVSGTPDSSARASFTATLGNKLPGSLEVTGGATEFSVQLIPMIAGLGPAMRAGESISYATGDGTRLTYTFKHNGVKEDIVLSKTPAKDFALQYFVKLDSSLEAKLDEKGNLLVYGPDDVLSGFIQTGDEKSAGLVMKARQNAPKNHLLYIIPAPVVIDGKGENHKDRAFYSFSSNTLTVHTKNIALLAAPVTIDPSVVVTSTADFATGNNEGMIAFDTDTISRATYGGSVGSWSVNPTSFSTGRYHHTSIAYNGYLYVLGGFNGGMLNDVQYAPINSNGTVGAWNPTTSFPTARNSHTSVVYNGYLYVIGGFNGNWLNDVQYARINSNGTISPGAWTANPTSFTTGRSAHTSVAYNGYLYVIGGSNAGVYLNDVQFAPFHADGTVGAWTANPTSFPNARFRHTSVAYNGNLYVIGGNNGSEFNDVQFAPINSNDGSVGAWSATTSFPTARDSHTSVVNNGYLYVIGGKSLLSGRLNDVQYAPIHASGRLGAWSATPVGFTTAREAHTSVAYNGYLYVIGGYNGSYLNDVQLARINSNIGTVGAWSSTTSLPTARTHHTSVAYNGYVYVIGGTDGTPGLLSEVRFAPIDSAGQLGTWSATTSFNVGRVGHTSVAYNGYLYVIGGGASIAGYDNNVQFAAINSDGTVGAWSATTSFNTGRSGHTSVAYNGYLYVIGGNNGILSFNGTVESAPINSNGTVGAWSFVSTIPTSRTEHTSVVYNGYLYIIGGYSNMGLLSDVQFAAINSNGTVGSWSATTSFTAKRDSHSSFAYNGYLYVIGGSNSGGDFDDVQFAPINSDGTVGAWNGTTSFPVARNSHASVFYNGYLYVIGGTGFGNSTRLNDVRFAAINSNGTVGLWNVGATFSTARGYHTSVAYNGYLYVIGGWNGSPLNDVQYAPINSDGTVGAWTLNSTTFSTARYGHTSVAYNGYLYVIGGWNGSPLNDVQYAPINSNGSVGVWSFNPTSLPTARYDHTSVVYNGYLYVIGGNFGGFLNDVQFAPINGTGTVGPWSATTSFPTARYQHSSVAYNGYMYVIGGWNGSPLSDVQFAPINSDGTISPGGWSSTDRFATARRYHTSVGYNGYLYVIGGYNGSFFNDVQFGPIDSGGKIGAWSPTTSFPNTRSGHTSVVYNGYLYVIGGAAGSGGYLNDVQVVPIKTPSPRAAYSKLLDLGSNRDINSVQFSSTSGRKGITNLTYAVAPEGTGVFGSRTTISNASSGTLYTSGLTCGRYIWTRFDLDDSNAATIDTGGTIGRKDVLDFSVDHVPGGRPVITSITDVVDCAQSGIQINFTSGNGATSHNLLRDGLVVVTGYTSGSTYNPGDTPSHSYVVRSVNGTCPGDSAPSSFADGNNGEGPPITSITDVSACAQSGIQINFTSVNGATSHNLLKDGLVVVPGYTSGTTYNPGNTASHSYVVRSLNGSCPGDSVPSSFTDAINTPPVITTINDSDACSKVEIIQVNFSSGGGATSHTLLQDGAVVVTGYTSGAIHYPWDTASHSYVVRATYGTCSIDSAPSSFAAVSNKPAAPGNTLIGTKTADVHLSWATASGATSYNVKRCDATSGSCAPAAVANTSALSWNATDLGDGNHYFYSIESVNGSCVSCSSVSTVEYLTHIANIGWAASWASNNEIVGTPGGNQLEAIRIAEPSCGIAYQAHVANIGWMAEVSNGAVAGTTGQGKSLQAIKIRLTGAEANLHVCYTAYVQNQGWQDEVCDGAQAGTTGLGLAIQAIQIRVATY